MKKEIYSLLIFILIQIPLSAQNTGPAYSVFLMGDGGEPIHGGKDPVLRSLQTQLQKSGKNGTLVLLGDNIYPKGLVEEGNHQRAEAELRLSEQLKIIRDFAGKSFIVPGNHDWQQGGRNGWEYVKNQEKFVEEFLQDDKVFFPKGGCPTPQEISVNSQLSLILLDTQWPLHQWDKPGPESDCEVKSLDGLFSAVSDILERNRDKRVLVMGHHPMYSHGSHGGYFTLKDHLLPLHALGLNIPLPLIGSVYPLYRKFIGNIQDIRHPKYQEMRNGLVNILKNHKNVIYANGHDHNLQLIVRDSINYITSGAASESSAAGEGKDTKFVASVKGFARLDFYENGKIMLLFYEGDGQEGKELFRTELNVKSGLTQQREEFRQNQLKSLTVVPNKKFKAKGLKRLFLGKNYRDIWTKPITVPMLNFQEEQGGLHIIQKGGGFQTLSLRYEAGNGGKFVTRSIEKFPEKAIPPPLLSPFTLDIVGDQVSAAHPFAALVIPPLAEAAGVFHTNPRLVVIPEDTTLRQYRKQFSNQLALFEERPDEGFQGSSKNYSTPKVVEKLAQDNHNRVDQKEVLRARLFDMLIGDWDRHDDQWRWAGFEEGKELILKPIPRDRDQAFFLGDGILLNLLSRKWIMPKLQGFHSKIRDVPGLNFNARYFDRSFLTGMNREDWLNMAVEIKQKLSDKLIDSAVTNLPKPDDHAALIAERLKSRRDHLPDFALIQHDFLAKEVDILGSNKSETIQVKRLEDGQTEVSIFDNPKKDEVPRQLYHRIFSPELTREIRIWGLDGADKFTINGEAERAIKLRLFGGKGNDLFADSSRISKGGKKDYIYDRIKGTTIYNCSEVKDMTSDKYLRDNDFDRLSFKYDRLSPLLTFAYNPDDGIFAGAGLQYTRQGFRKEPFASQHSLSGDFAFNTHAFNLSYTGEFVDLIGSTDLELKSTVQQSSMTSNFFGIGNETVYRKEKKIDYYRFNYSNYESSVMFRNHLGKTVFSYGVIQNAFKIDENPGHYLSEYAPSGSDVYQKKDFLGVKTGFTIDNRDSKIWTTRGILWDLASTYQHGISSSARDEYMNLKTNLAFYWSARIPATVIFATRFGGAVNFTDYEFYQANYLDGLSNIRGFRRNRFAGQSSFYNNTEVRLKLFNVRNYFFPAYAGILAFNDIGRVWSRNESSSKWHHAYGGGFWFAPFNVAVISAMYSISEEDHLPIIKFGFFF